MTLQNKGFEEYPRFILVKDRKPFLVKKGALYEPRTWVTLDLIEKKQQEHPDTELGFIFTAESGLFFIDIDHCLSKGAWSNLANEVCGMFPGCYQEVSRSGQGLHIIGSLPDVILPPFKNKNTPLGLEFYTHKRIVFLTGSQAVGNVSIVGHNIETFIKKYMLDENPSANYQIPIDPDKELIQKMLKSSSPQNLFGDKVCFRDLWEAEAEPLGIAWPTSGRPFDHSSADLSLCAHLAFWTQKDPNAIDRLFRQSKLMRLKWEREDYRDMTIKKAIATCVTVYNKLDVFNCPPALS